ncbi:MAG: O-antigen ligase family protein [Planctomycetes bacterium]|nr:O-antigen ligase family protein [Planctomycetota bacterium]
MSLTAAVFWLTYIIGTCVAVAMPAIGVALYVLVYHLNPEFQWWGESIRTTGLRTSFFVVIACLVGMLLQGKHRRDVRLHMWPYALMVALAVWSWASLTWGVALTERGSFQVEKFTKILVFIFILIRCASRPRELNLVLWAWVIGVGYVGYQAWGGVGERIGGRLSQGIGGPDFAESSDLAAHLIASLPLIGAMFFNARTWKGRSVTLIIGALAVNAILLTRTRNAVFGLTAMAVASAFSLPRGYRVKGWTAIVVGGLLAYQLTDSGWWTRMSTIFEYSGDAAATDRLRFWRAAVDMSIDHPLGIGVGNFQHYVLEYVPKLTIIRSAHSTYFECLAELGAPGLILLLTIIVAVMIRLNRVRRDARRIDPVVRMRLGGCETQLHLGWQAMALRAGLVGYLVCAMFTTRLWAEDLWILLGLSICLGNVSRHAEMAQAEAPSNFTAVDSVRSLGSPPNPSPEPVLEDGIPKGAPGAYPMGR